MQQTWLILPDFLLILLGGLLRRWSPFSAEFWQGLEKLVYFVLFPALLFVAVIRVPFVRQDLPFVVVGISITLCGAALGYLGRPLLNVNEPTFASGVQCAFRFNSFLALGPAAILGGEAGTALISLLIGASVPVCNLISVWGLARTQKLRVLGELSRNPLILATLIGFLCNAAGLRLIGPLTQTLTRLGQASVPLGLIAVGAGLRLGAARDAPWLAIWMIAVKLFALPTLACLFADQAHLTSLQTQMMVLFAALPSASSSYILATRMGGNGPLVAFIVSAATVGAIFTLPLWLSVVL